MKRVSFNFLIVGWALVFGKGTWASQDCLKYFGEEPPCHGQMGSCISNPDGSEGGFVAETAQVRWTRHWFKRNTDFYIHPTASVCDFAEVEDARIEAAVRVSGRARVLRGAVIQPGAHVLDYALVYAKGVVLASTQVGGFTIRDGHAGTPHLERPRSQFRLREELNLLLAHAEKTLAGGLSADHYDYLVSRISQSGSPTDFFRLLAVSKVHGYPLRFENSGEANIRALFLRFISQKGVDLDQLLNDLELLQEGEEIPIQRKNWAEILNRVPSYAFGRYLERSPFYSQQEEGWTLQEQKEFLLKLRDEYRLKFTPNLFAVLEFANERFIQTGDLNESLGYLGSGLKGVVYQFGLLRAEKSEKVALRIFLEGASEDDALSHLLVGVQYLKGQCEVPVDRSLARHFFEKSTGKVPKYLLSAYSHFYYSEWVRTDFKVFLGDETWVDDCPICLEPFDETSPVHLLNCGHCFCPGCMDQVKARLKKECPKCRSMIH